MSVQRSSEPFGLSWRWPSTVVQAPAQGTMTTNSPRCQGKPTFQKKRVNASLVSSKWPLGHSLGGTVLSQLESKSHSPESLNRLCIHYFIKWNRTKISCLHTFLFLYKQTVFTGCDEVLSIVFVCVSECKCDDVCLCVCEQESKICKCDYAIF